MTVHGELVEIHWLRLEETQTAGSALGREKSSEAVN